MKLCLKALDVIDQLSINYQNNKLLNAQQAIFKLWVLTPLAVLMQL